MNGLQTFANEEFGAVRSLMIEDMPWFVGYDVAKALGYVKPRNAISVHVDDEDKNTALIQGAIQGGTQGNPNMTIINESGLYSLILSSKLPSPPPSVSSAGSRPKCCQPSAGLEGVERLHKRRRKRFRHGRLRTTITSAPRPSSPPAKTSACPMCWRT